MGDILIVDDEKDIRELVSDILIDEGYTTQLAANSEDTFKSIEKSKPKLIILDIWLKESKLDGIDILKHVKLNNPDIPVVCTEPNSLYIFTMEAHWVLNGKPNRLDEILKKNIK